MKSESEKDEQLKDAANILLIGLVLICVVTGMAFGVIWALILAAFLCIVVALVKADGAR